MRSCSAVLGLAETRATTERVTLAFSATMWRVTMLNRVLCLTGAGWRNFLDCRYSPLTYCAAGDLRTNLSTRKLIWSLTDLGHPYSV